MIKIILIALVFVYIYTSIMENVHNKGVKYYKNDSSIYDLGIEYTPDLSKYKWLHYVSHICVILLPFCFGLNITTEFIKYFLTILVIRLIVISITILPKHSSCDNSNFKFHNYIIGGCYENLSGHFASLMLLSLILLDKNIISNWSCVILNIINALFILSLRFHYSIDLVLGFMTVIIVYNNKLKINI